MIQQRRGQVTERVEKPERLGWIEPTYLNIDWDVGANKFPTPSKEITRDEFDLLRDHGTYGLCGINYDNTVWLPDGTQVHDIHYYFYPHCALAITSNYMRYGEYKESQSAKSKGDFIPAYVIKDGVLTEEHSYVYARRYFRIGCEHNWKELSMAESKTEGVLHFGNCWHVNKCSDCGMVWSYDSSG